ncbi:murein hydrolase activator EnvC family protein [Flavobacterium sp.]|jgi:septal ring factor EnvC (AmiA/AmiB activator)|uniref:murein hydrolase activator EnvC family protein n=1 Tax=Flavobacterium sp. TaxID=239 RepID=UPI0037C1B0ED
MTKYIFSLVFLVLSSLVWSQTDTQKKLEERKARLMEEIQLNEKLLREQKKKEKSVVNIIQAQNSKISLREKLIVTNEMQAKLLNDDIYKNQIQLNKLNRELKLLKDDYANMIVKSYKSRSERSRAMFLLSSSSFLQAYKRAQYMKQYAGYRKNQGEEIINKSAEIEVQNKKLAEVKNEKIQLIAEQEKEKSVLEEERKEQQKLVNSIKKDQKKLVAEINKKQKEAREIDRKIQELIRAAIAEANKKTAKKSGAKTVSTGTSSSKIVLTPEGKIISDNFKANKGRLPWPVKKGFVSIKFGSQPHPVVKTTQINSNGVEITTDQGADAIAVFGGEVFLVQIITPIKKAVYVQHGDFITVYYNLSSVNVSKGDKVKEKQVIGKIFTDGNGKTAIKFSVLQNDVFLNPQSWLVPN